MASEEIRERCYSHPNPHTPPTFTCPLRRISSLIFLAALSAFSSCSCSALRLAKDFESCEEVR